MNIEKELFPNSGKIMIELDRFRMQIVDAELDPIDVEFDGGNAVVIDASDYTYITLTANNLATLLEGIERCDEYINNEKYEIEK